MLNRRQAERAIAAGVTTLVVAHYSEDKVKPFEFRVPDGMGGMKIVIEWAESVVAARVAAQSKYGN